MLHGGAAAPDGQHSEAAAAGGHTYTCGDKREKPDERDEEDEAPATRPCLLLENGAHGGAASRACSVARQQARRFLPARQCASSNSVFTPLRSATHPSMMLRGVQEMYRENILFDVTMRVDDEDFPAHRLILAAASDFLRSANSPGPLHVNLLRLARAPESFDRDGAALHARARRMNLDQQRRLQACRKQKVRAHTNTDSLGACAEPCWQGPGERAKRKSCGWMASTDTLFGWCSITFTPARSSQAGWRKCLT